jgi:hypothetical protein
VEFEWVYRDYANIFDGESWGTPQRIDAIDYELGGNPVIAMDGSGHAIAAFSDGAASQKLFANRWDGSAWSGPENLASSLDTITLQYPAVAMDGTGKAIAVFEGGVERFYLRQPLERVGLDGGDGQRDRYRLPGYRDGRLRQRDGGLHKI